MKMHAIEGVKTTDFPAEEIIQENLDYLYYISSN